MAKRYLVIGIMMAKMMFWHKRRKRAKPVIGFALFLRLCLDAVLVMTFYPMHILIILSQNSSEFLPYHHLNKTPFQKT